MCLVLFSGLETIAGELGYGFGCLEKLCELFKAFLNIVRMVLD